MKTLHVFCKESFCRSAVPGQVVSSILNCLQGVLPDFMLGSRG